MLGQFDLSQQGSVKFTQVLDLLDATVSIQAGNSQHDIFVTTDLAAAGYGQLDTRAHGLYLPRWMVKPFLDGSISWNVRVKFCLVYPGLTDEIAEEIIAARNDGSDSETRKFETWLAIEGYLTIEEMRALLPLVTCGGDVFKAQIIGYLEGEAVLFTGGSGRQRGWAGSGDLCSLGNWTIWAADLT